MRPAGPQLRLKDFQYFILIKRQGPGFRVQTSNQAVQLRRRPGKIQSLQFFGKSRGKGNSLGGLGLPDDLPGLARPAAPLPAGGRPYRPDAPPSVPAVSSSRMASDSCRKISPASISSVSHIMVMPVSASPLIIAQFIGRGPPIAGQQGGMDIQNSQSRNIQNLLGQHLAEGHHQDQIRLQSAQLVDDISLTFEAGLPDRQAPGHGLCLHRRKSQALPAPPGAVRLRNHGRQFKTV